MLNFPTWVPKLIQRDKLLHAGIGAATVLAVLLLLAIAKHNIGISLAVSGVLVGLAYEYQRKLRSEGAFSMINAAATAAPGFVVWGALAAFGLR